MSGRSSRPRSSRSFCGRGTPAPIDPPKTLVARGPYRWTRNPMYVAVTSVLIGECMMTRSPSLWRHALAVFVGFNLFVRLYEEPTLREKFGDEYGAYCARVPRWIVKMPLIAVVSLACAWTVHAQTARPAPTPREPIGAILDAFADHDVVGLSAGGHGDMRAVDFEVALIRSPRFASMPIDVVMENGNARHQDVMDRYVRGGDVPFSALRRVWDDTTQPQVVSDLEPNPIYVALRAVNATLPRNRQHRAVLGDPPIDWSTVHTHDEFQKWLAQRDSSGAETTRREILARGRRALALYGAGHLQRRQQATNYKMDHPLAQTVISLLDRAGVRTFVVDSVGARDVSWPVPSLALIRGTTMGAEAVPPLGLPRVDVKPDGTFVPIPREQWIDLKEEEQIDAFVYLGPASTVRERPLPPSLCTDPGYLDNRLQRMAIGGLPKSESDRLKNFCASAKP
jgi:hypothetical protein